MPPGSDHDAAVILWFIARRASGGGSSFAGCDGLAALVLELAGAGG